MEHIKGMEQTPGPWEIDLSEEYYKPCIRHNGVVLCLLPAYVPANAKLIAASPDLLAACEEAFSQLSQGKWLSPDEAELSIQLEQAISKAKGEHHEPGPEDRAE